MAAEAGACRCAAEDATSATVRIGRVGERVASQLVAAEASFSADSLIVASAAVGMDCFGRAGSSALLTATGGTCLALQEEVGSLPAKQRSSHLQSPT